MILVAPFWPARVCQVTFIYLALFKAALQRKKKNNAKRFVSRRK